MFNKLRRKWQAWQLKHKRIPESCWLHAAETLHAVKHLSREDEVRLRELTSLFLQKKHINPAGELQLDQHMQVELAALACLPILELGLDWYDGWHEVVVYEQTFVVERDETDAYGVVHRVRRPLEGESWLHGPVILSWSDHVHDRQQPGSGHNVVIHEFAHKLDMRNGAANGMPPLHPDMNQPEWTRTFTAAWERLQKTLEHHHKPWINPYAATNPAEFFAVASEMFFEAPWKMYQHEPKLYQQMKAFYRQDPRMRYPQHGL